MSRPPESRQGLACGACGGALEARADGTLACLAWGRCGQAGQRWRDGRRVWGLVREPTRAERSRPSLARCSRKRAGADGITAVRNCDCAPWVCWCLGGRVVAPEGDSGGYW